MPSPSDPRRHSDRPSTPSQQHQEEQDRSLEDLQRRAERQEALNRREVSAHRLDAVSAIEAAKKAEEEQAKAERIEQAEAKRRRRRQKKNTQAQRQTDWDKWQQKLAHEQQLLAALRLGQAHHPAVRVQLQERQAAENRRAKKEGRDPLQLQLSATKEMRQCRARIQTAEQRLAKMSDPMDVKTASKSARRDAVIARLRSYREGLAEEMRQRVGAVAYEIEHPAVHGCAVGMKGAPDVCLVAADGSWLGQYMTNSRSQSVGLGMDVIQGVSGTRDRRRAWLHDIIISPEVGVQWSAEDWQRAAAWTAALFGAKGYACVQHRKARRPTPDQAAHAQQTGDCRELEHLQQHSHAHVLIAAADADEDALQNRWALASLGTQLAASTTGREAPEAVIGGYDRAMMQAWYRACGQEFVVDDQVRGPEAERVWTRSPDYDAFTDAAFAIHARLKGAPEPPPGLCLRAKAAFIGPDQARAHLKHVYHVRSN